MRQLPATDAVEAAFRCPVSQVPREAFAADSAFYWLHTAPGAATARTAVLLCPGFFWDLVQPYHGMRLLADGFAAAGYPTLRLGYPGTGDAADLPPGTDPWAAWSAAVEAGVTRARDVTGATHVVLCGLRLGATLAALAAARCPEVAGLILIAPVLRGKSYLRQLRVEAKLECGDTGQDGELVFHETRFDADAASRLAALDLADLALPPRLKLAMFLQAPSTPATQTAAAWTAQGITVSLPAYAGLAPLLRQNVQEGGDPVDFAGVVGWLRAALPPATAGGVASPPPRELLIGDGFSERPVAFGDGLFGVLCHPAHGAGGGQAMLIVNTGRDPHVGIARFGVELARQLARRGVGSLRMDFAGLGDSDGLAGAATALSSLFDDKRNTDIAAGLDVLDACGYRAIALHGLCSGAYHAFHAAVDDVRVTTLLLVNMPLFVWVPEETAHFAEHKLTPARRYLHRLLQPRSWWRLLAGRIDVLGVARAQLARLRERRAGTGDVARDGFARLGARKVRTLMLYSPDDPGIEALKQALGTAIGTAPYPEAQVTIVAGMNHTLSGATMRAEAAGRMIDFLCGAER